MAGQGVTNMFTNPRFNMRGMASVERYDSVLSAYRTLGRVRDVACDSQEAFVEQFGTKKGKRVTTQKRNVESRWWLTCTLAETLMPEVRRLMAGVTAEQQSLTAMDVVADMIVRSLYNDDVAYVTNEYGLPLQTKFPRPTISSITAAGSSGSGWSVATYYFQIAPGWYKAGVSSITTFEDEVDLTFTHGRKSEVSNVAVAGATNTVTINTGAYNTDNIPTPDFWVVIQSSAAAMTSPKVSTVAYTGAQAIALASPLTATYADAYNVGVESIANYSTGTATFTQLTHGTDHTVDVEQGTVKRIPGGAIDHGDDVRLTVWNVVNARLVTDLTSEVSANNVSKIRLTRLEESRDINSRTVYGATGEQVILYSVDLSSESRSMGFSEDDFDPGTQMRWEVLFDDTEASYGEHTIHSHDLANWTANYE